MRTQCLATVTKVLHFSEPGALGEELTDLPISSFIASLLSQKDSTTVAKALQLAEILMHKLPAIFSKHFLKEGVVHAIEQLAGSVPQAAGEEKEKARSKAAKRASQRLKVRMASCCAMVPWPSCYCNRDCITHAFSAVCMHLCLHCVQTAHKPNFG